MRLQLKEGVTLSSVQKKFNEAFPYLKLEFFKRPDTSKKVPPKEELLRPDEVASRYVAANGSPINIDIDNKMTVAGLEDEFRAKTGLGVQVFRKFGSVWVETILTNDWTLEQQNSEGESISRH
jgi:hypothetical protein